MSLLSFQNEFRILRRLESIINDSLDFDIFTKINVTSFCTSLACQSKAVEKCKQTSNSSLLGSIVIKQMLVLEICSFYGLLVPSNIYILR